MVAVSLKLVSRLAERCLMRHGVAASDAREVVSALMIAELAGHQSHGFMRAIEYVECIRSGQIDPGARISASRKGNAWQIDGNGSLGILCLRAVAEKILQELESSRFAAVTLVNSNHVGRLAPVGDEIARRGAIVLGFCNYRGAGKRVAAPGVRVPLLATNPILFACPAADRAPFVLDMSTSSVAEGKVRLRAISGSRLPSRTWMIDRRWNPTTDSSALYHEDEPAILSPLGGKEHGHKGFGLAVMAEVLAGVLTGGEFAAVQDGPGGNCALFIAVSPEFFGMSVGEFSQRARELFEYCESAEVVDAAFPMKLPGNRRTVPTPTVIEMPEALFQQLVTFAGRATVFDTSERQSYECATGIVPSVL